MTGPLHGPGPAILVGRHACRHGPVFAGHDDGDGQATQVVKGLLYAAFTGAF